MERDYGRVGTRVLCKDGALRFNDYGAQGAARVAGHPEVNAILTNRNIMLQYKCWVRWQVSAPDKSTWCNSRVL